MNAKEHPVRIPLQQQVENLLEDTEAMATWETACIDKNAVLRQGQRLRQALDALYTQFQRYKDAAMLCPQDGKTGPCTFQKKDDGLRYCFKCSSLHPEDANKEHSNDLYVIENHEQCIADALDVTCMILRASAEIEALQWVNVMARRIQAHLLDNPEEPEEDDGM